MRPVARAPWRGRCCWPPDAWTRWWPAPLGGMVAAHLAAAGAVRGAAFLGSFTRPSQLGVRGRVIGMMGPIAMWGRPGIVAAGLAAWKPVSLAQVAEVVPTTHVERSTTWHRALAIGDEPPPPELRRLSVSCVCIQGDRDVLVPPSTLERLAASLPSGTPRHLLRGAGHVPYFTHPEACARLLRPWLEALVPAEPVSEPAFEASWQQRPRMAGSAA
ncbi:alpha/beta fold hydrolase [Pyxidicoccus sp. 3LFB2]